MNHNDLQSDSGRLGVVVLGAGYAGALRPTDCSSTPISTPHRSMPHCASWVEG
ncbi:hypothetical protein [Gordonia terrae]